MKELVIKKCNKCNAMIKIIEDCKCENCGITCCDEQMQQLIPNSTDAVVEKHVPEYVIKENKIIVKVNHVMEEEHFIEWISMVSDNNEYTKYFKPGEVCEVEFDKMPNAKLYAYCNKHGLWKKEVE